MSMDKLYRKYGGNAILPPPPVEEVEDVKIPSFGKLPEIQDPDLSEMEKNWFIYDRDHPKLLKMLEKQRLEKEQMEDPERAWKEDPEKEVPEKDITLRDTIPSLPIANKDITLHDTIPVFPFAKKTSSKTDHLLQRCAFFYKLANKY